jgi:hypothetical protein
MNDDSRLDYSDAYPDDESNHTTMPNYYYDAPDDFVPADEVTVIAKMEQPPARLFNGHAVVYVENEHTVVCAIRGVDGKHHVKWEASLPYPRGARVGVRQEVTYSADGYPCRHGEEPECGYHVEPDKTKLPIVWTPSNEMDDDIITGLGNWYTVTDIRICRASEVTYDEAQAAGLRVIDRFPHLFTMAAYGIKHDKDKLAQLKATLTASTIKTSSASNLTNG